MQFLKPLILTVSILLFSFPSFGQEVAEKENAKDQQDPNIAGQWTKPVNGIRMMAKFIQSDYPTEQIQILVFLQNCSEKKIAVPPLNSERILTFKNSKTETFFGGNLRIVAEPLDGQKPLLKAQKVTGGGMQRLEAALPPGEIRLHCISVRTAPDLAKQKMQQANQNIVWSETVYGREFSDPNSKGRWRFSLSYRPDEQFSVSDGKMKKMERAMVTVPKIWKDVQIDLPALELDWVPPSGADRLRDAVQ